MQKPSEREGRCTVTQEAEDNRLPDPCAGIPIERPFNLAVSRQTESLDQGGDREEDPGIDRHRQRQHIK